MAQLASVGAAFGQTTDPLKTLRVGHARLIALDTDIERIRTLARDFPQVRRILGDLEKEAERLDTTPPVEYRLAASRIVAQSVHALDRIYTLALLYRLDGKQGHFDRAVKELRAAAAFRDWNPAYFVDTAQMTHALAIGYDWLYESLQDTDRTLIRNAIVQKGLIPGLLGYQAQSPWVNGRDHWNVICNTGMALGALAVADEELEKSTSILKSALDSIQRGIAPYGTDGGWSEGPAYWDDATRYLATFLAALDSALGTDFGISNQQELTRTGRFRIYSSSPVNKTFNYGDASDDLVDEPAMFWLARRYSQPVFTWQQQRLVERSTNAEPLDLIWYQREPKIPQGPQWPLDTIFPSVQCAFFRSSWEDPSALFLAVKGGDNKGPRVHLDLGSFVFDAGGVRWALDLGHDDLNLPGYQGRQRWTYYRTRTESHNTLLIDGENQDLRAEAHIVRHQFAPELAWVQIDMSKVYPTKVKQFQRRIGLANRQAVLIQDTVQSDQPIDVLWGMVTDAQIAVNGRTAELTKEGWTLSAEIRTPRHAVFDVASTTPHPPQAQNNGTRKLVVRVGDRVTDLDMNIILTPHKTGQPKPKVIARLPV